MGPSDNPGISFDGTEHFSISSPTPSWVAPLIPFLPEKPPSLYRDNPERLLEDLQGDENPLEGLATLTPFPLAQHRHAPPVPGHLTAFLLCVPC